MKQVIAVSVLVLFQWTVFGENLVLFDKAPIYSDAGGNNVIRRASVFDSVNLSIMKKNRYKIETEIGTGYIDENDVSVINKSWKSFVFNQKLSISLPELDKMKIEQLKIREDSRGELTKRSQVLIVPNRYMVVAYRSKNPSDKRDSFFPYFNIEGYKSININGKKCLYYEGKDPNPDSDDLYSYYLLVIPDDAEYSYYLKVQIWDNNILNKKKYESMAKKILFSFKL